jgi:phosphoglycerate dehydrogenase-like enzyme
MKPSIAYLGAPEGFEALRGLVGPRADTVNVEATPAALAQALRTASGLLDASMRVPLTQELVDGASHLRIVSCATTGSDHISRPATESRGIAVRTLREDGALLQNLTPAAELTWALLMACARKLPAAIDHVHAGKWVREEFPGTMLNGKQLGLIGLGRIGGWMSRYARAFGMAVVGYDPHQATVPEGVQRAPLDELFRTSDFISVHVHLTPETTGMVTRALLEQVKPGAVILNTSRGAIVDERALLDGLKTGRIGGAGLDVLEGEPKTADHPLVEYGRSHPNVLITPHIGGFSPDAVRIVCRRAGEKIVEHLGL